MEEEFEREIELSEGERFADNLAAAVKPLRPPVLDGGSHKVCWLIISALANHCAADENEIIDRLTGYLFDEEEAGQVAAYKEKLSHAEKK